MDKTIETPFFDAFEATGGPVANCIKYINDKYDLGIYPKEKKARPRWEENYYKEELPQIIQKQYEAFNGKVVLTQRSPLMDEIEANIYELQGKDREGYILGLLTPFKEIANIYNPQGIINRINRGIEYYQSNLKMWEARPQDEQLFDVAGKPSGTPKEQAEACKRQIEKNKNQIERQKFISEQYRCATNCFYSGNKPCNVEAFLADFHSVFCMYANRLDAVLLKFGIDLLRLQKENGIYLKDYRIMSDVAYYLGGYDVAEELINKLPKAEGGKPQQKTTELPKKRGRKTKPFIDTIIGPNKEDTLRLLHSLIDTEHGKRAIIFLAVAVKEGIITKPTSTQILTEFGRIGHKSLVEKYMYTSIYNDDEINGARIALKG